MSNFDDTYYSFVADFTYSSCVPKGMINSLDFVVHFPLTNLIIWRKNK